MNRITWSTDPFHQLKRIIETTVMDEHKKKVLLHNLEIFKTKLKEAQHAH